MAKLLSNGAHCRKKGREKISVCWEKRARMAEWRIVEGNGEGGTQAHRGGAWYIKPRVLQVSKSNAHDVTLVNVSRNLTGMYKCEVSDGVTFHTLIERARMEVVGKCMCVCMCVAILAD